jgi:uncharacterized protein YjbI with pentapeptide repeats
MPAPEPIPDLLKAVNEASGKAFALWITFLTVGTYLAISIGTTTHVQLLLAGPVKLPLLGVDLPLFAFYGFAPPLYVVLHLYVLMQLYLLARLLRLFDDDLRAADMIEQDRRRVRGQLDKFVFTQALIGAPQDGVVRWFLRAAVWLSFVVGPVLLLLGFQLRFLPYHSVEVTYVHRAALLLDLVMLLLLWPKISRRALEPRDWKAFCRVGAVGFIGVLLGGFSAFVATVPDELVNQPLLNKWRLRLFSQSISISGERLVEPDEAKLKNLAVTLSLAERDLRQAILASSDLRKADLHLANLSDAYLAYATLRGADLRWADLRGAMLFDADLGNANLSSADLSGAILNKANLSGASLTKVYLTNAELTKADLSGADLSGADLSNARYLTQAQLDKACGTDAKLSPGLTLNKPCPKPESK